MVGVSWCAARLPDLQGSHWWWWCVQGDWVCKDCADGKPAPPREATSAREKFLQQAGLGLARIEELWQEDGEQHCRLRWYEVPEATDRGRQVGGHTLGSSAESA